MLSQPLTLSRIRLRFRTQALITDLGDHFQVAQNADKISYILVNLLKTDFAFGLTAESLQTLRGKQDVVLAEMAHCEVSV